MTNTTINFPARFAFVNPDGTLTDEARRMLFRLSQIVGGNSGVTIGDVDLLAQFAPAPSPQAADAPFEFMPVPLQIEAMQAQIEAAQANLAELQKALQSLALEAMFAPAKDVPLIGSTTISTGVGSVRMSTANPATNTAWLPFQMGGSTYYVPGWATNAP